MDLLEQIVARAKADKQRIVLPEAEEERTLRAADRVLADDIANLILMETQPTYVSLPQSGGLRTLTRLPLLTQKTTQRVKSMPLNWPNYAKRKV